MTRKRSHPPAHPTSIRIPHDTSEWIKALAKEQRRTVSWIICEMLAQYKAWQEAKKNTPFK